MFKRMKSTRILPYATVMTFMVIFLAACANQPVAQPVAQANSGGAGADTSSVTPIAGSDLKIASKGEVSFAKDIMPILQASCVSCHGGQKTSRGLDLKTFASLMAGSQNGPMVVPGDAAGSMLVQSVQSGKMPKEGTLLTPEQIQLLVNWVSVGAKNN